MYVHVYNARRMCVPSSVLLDCQKLSYKLKHGSGNFIINKLREALYLESRSSIFTFSSRFAKKVDVQKRPQKVSPARQPTSQKRVFSKF